MPQPRLVHRHILDPRPRSESRRQPYADAVNIPLAELPQRTHELPDPRHTIPVAGPADLVRQTLSWLAAHGRHGTHTDPVPAPANGASPDIGRLWKPHPFLTDIVTHLRPTRALDLACGCGREAVFLAAAGWHVTAVDILPDAIDRARALANHCAPALNPITWKVADLEHEPPPYQNPDLVTCFRFLHRPLLKHLPDWLTPGGSFILETFTTTHRARHGRPARDEHVLQPGEVYQLLPDFETLHASEDWRGDIHTARLWARKPT